MFATRFLLAALLLSSFVRAQDPAEKKTPVLKVHDVTGGETRAKKDRLRRRSEGRPPSTCHPQPDAFDRPMAVPQAFR